MFDDAVRDRLANLHARDARDQIVEALQMLHVHGRVDIDARIEQLLYVLIALRVTRARHIGVRQLVHQCQLRLAAQQRIEIEFIENAASVLDLAARQLRHPVQ